MASWNGPNETTRGHQSEHVINAPEVYTALYSHVVPFPASGSDPHPTAHFYSYIMGHKRPPVSRILALPLQSPQHRRRRGE